MYLRINYFSTSIKYLTYSLLCLVFLNCKDNKDAKTTSPVKAQPLVQEKAVTSLYEDLEGNAVSLKDFKGKRILMNYWATWCRPCIEEMPDLLELQSILEKENYVFLLASDQSVEKIKKFKLDRGFDFKFIKYNGSYPEKDISALPVTLIYNEVGEQVARFDGGMSWNTPEMVERLTNIN
ncbi:TlpA disulfide reductase family protein [Maribacter confluentis]|uniref:TlpA disulfide reductase family protein n=1 Tax=Maribacter confluentis TaxID=1656093 RepID=A0ABT8RKZ8_9FLAO|nr:TlpA disulfide reductase family protein [Maribacter confluentis]MDO1511142.1 TlpA disulfide reductase family protein [Maribacter confluentis]